MEVSGAERVSTKTKRDPSLWGLAVLCLLRERPMHPYEMLSVLRQRHKEDLLVLKPGSIYHSINRLEKRGLIEAVETSRQGGRPARTVYRLLPEGERTLLDWLKDLLSRPVMEPSDFMTALSHLPHLSVDDARSALRQRLAQLEAGIEELDGLIRQLEPVIGRLPVIEVEYLRTMRRSELDWVRGILQELDEGRLSWDLETLAAALRDS